MATLLNLPVTTMHRPVGCRRGLLASRSTPSSDARAVTHAAAAVLRSPPRTRARGMKRAQLPVSPTETPDDYAASESMSPLKRQRTNANAEAEAEDCIIVLDSTDDEEGSIIGDSDADEAPQTPPKQTRQPKQAMQRTPPRLRHRAKHFASNLVQDAPKIPSNTSKATKSTKTPKATTPSKSAAKPAPRRNTRAAARQRTPAPSPQQPVRRSTRSQRTDTAPSPTQPQFVRRSTRSRQPPPLLQTHVPPPAAKAPPKKQKPAPKKPANTKATAKKASQPVRRSTRSRPTTSSQPSPPPRRSSRNQRAITPPLPPAPPTSRRSTRNRRPPPSLQAPLPSAPLSPQKPPSHKKASPPTPPPPPPVRTVTKCLLRAAAQAVDPSRQPPFPVCREAEVEAVSKFMHNRLAAQQGGCLYLYGGPGTGKTTCAKHCLRQLVQAKNIGAESGVYMNGTAFGGSALAHLARKLRVPSGVSPKEGLARRFLQTRGRRMTILLLDEVDHLNNKDVSQLVAWATHAHSRLVLVTISNSIDVMSHKCPYQHAHVEQLVFTTFNTKEIEKILVGRICRVQKVLGGDALSDARWGRILDPDAAGVCAKSVAARTGDLRGALGLCRTVLDTCAAKCSCECDAGIDTAAAVAVGGGGAGGGAGAADEPRVRVRMCNGDWDGPFAVTFADMRKAVRPAFRSLHVDTIASLPEKAHLLLFVALLYRQESLASSKDTTMPLNAIPLSLRDLQSRCNAFCSKTHLPPIRGEFNAILEMLIACALVTTASYDDYEWALSGHEEGEVVARWERFFEPAFQRVNDTSGSD